MHSPTHPPSLRIGRRLGSVTLRTWQTKHRGPLAIHASRGQGWDERGRELLAKLGTPAPDELPRGVVELVDVVRVDDLFIAAEIKNSPHAFGPYCWVLRNPRILTEPIPYKGSLAIFEVPDKLLGELYMTGIAGAL